MRFKIIIILVVFFLVSCQKDVTIEKEETDELPSWLLIDITDYGKIYDDNKAINEEYVGEVRFESGLIDLPMVQHSASITEGYDKYLYTDWKTMQEDPLGSIFIDPQCDIESSRNIVIYGHYVYPEDDPMRKERFTPLSTLWDEANYATNRYIYLIFEDEIRKYEIAHIYIATQTDDPLRPLKDDLYYMEADWGNRELEEYERRLDELDLYDTGVSLEDDSRFITLVCCVHDRDDQKQATIAKEIGVYRYR